MKKNTNIIIRLDEKQLLVIDSRSKKANLTRSEYIRQSAVSATIQKNDRDYQKVIAQISRIGNNLNQISKKVNSGEYNNGDIILNALLLIRNDLQTFLKG